MPISGYTILFSVPLAMEVYRGLTFAQVTGTIFSNSVCLNPTTSTKQTPRHMSNWVRDVDSSTVHWQLESSVTHGFVGSLEECRLTRVVSTTAGVQEELPAVIQFTHTLPTAIHFTHMLSTAIQFTHTLPNASSIALCKANTSVHPPAHSPLLLLSSLSCGVSVCMAVVASTCTWAGAGWRGTGRTAGINGADASLLPAAASAWMLWEASC